MKAIQVFNALGKYQTKDISISKVIGPRIVFQCPDNEWSYWVTKWQRGEIQAEPWPYNHVVWEK